MCLNHPETIPDPRSPPWSAEELSSVKSVPGAERLGIAVPDSDGTEQGGASLVLVEKTKFPN